MQNVLVDVLIHPSLAERPGLVLVVAGGFAAVAVLAVLGRALRSSVRLPWWPCLGVALLWALYAWWEAELQGKGYDIRVDLLVLHPALTLLSVLALVSVAWPLCRRHGRV